jgi:ADP-ribosylglycohydrolase
LSPHRTHFLAAAAAVAVAVAAAVVAVAAAAPVWQFPQEFALLLLPKKEKKMEKHYE